jgi:hypothetical protein
MKKACGDGRTSYGGRRAAAILHVDELTYSICTPANHPIMQGGVLPSYREISAALQRGLEILAVPAVREAHYGLDPDLDPGGPVCFEIPSDWEITFRGKKLVGSAQVRRAGGVLQHGTLPLHGDLTHHPLPVLSGDPWTSSVQTAGARATVEHALGRVVAGPSNRSGGEGFEESLVLAATRTGSRGTHPCTGTPSFDMGLTAGQSAESKPARNSFWQFENHFRKAKITQQQGEIQLRIFLRLFQNSVLEGGFRDHILCHPASFRFQVHLPLGEQPGLAIIHVGFLIIEGVNENLSCRKPNVKYTVDNPHVLRRELLQVDPGNHDAVRHE